MLFWPWNQRGHRKAVLWALKLRERRREARRVRGSGGRSSGAPPVMKAQPPQKRPRPREEPRCPVQPEALLSDAPDRASSFLPRGVTHGHVFSFVFWGAPSKSESPLTCEARAAQQGGAGGSSGTGLGSSITACKKVTRPAPPRSRRLHGNASPVGLAEPWFRQRQQQKPTIAIRGFSA